MPAPISIGEARKRSAAPDLLHHRVTRRPFRARILTSSDALGRRSTNQRIRNHRYALGRAGGIGDHAGGAVGTKECNVIRAIAALALASASTQPTATLTSTAPWWEKVTVTVTDDGNAQSCHYESSLGAGKGQDCSVTGNEAAITKSSSSASAKNQYTRITFERRFSPGAMPKAPELQPGELLLSGQVMALAIDGKGAVEHCRVVAKSGSVTPQYGCDEATAERFEASAVEPHARPPAREGYMTILVYGHSEHLV
jgi:hypothetical protein